MIQEQPCPRCATRRTVCMGHWGSICFNCRLHWDARESSGTRATARAPSPPTAALVPADRERLEIYRAAVLAGFYSDWTPCNGLRGPRSATTPIG
jgi:hypothetical protein